MATVVSQYETYIVDIDNKIAHVRFNRPEKANSLAQTGWDELETIFKELDLRSQLSVKDHELVDKHQVENSMSMCGMYMSRGKPISEKSRQIRPFTFKTVHVYPDMYYVSQSGMIVQSLERKEGVMPPKLMHEAPKVQAPPVAPK